MARKRQPIHPDIREILTINKNSLFIGRFLRCYRPNRLRSLTKQNDQTLRRLEKVSDDS